MNDVKAEPDCQTVSFSFFEPENDIIEDKIRGPYLEEICYSPRSNNWIDDTLF